jgi:hypothetical protein
MINGYLNGKRIHYTNPFKFLFFTATAYYLTITYFDIQLPFSKDSQHTGEIVQALLSYLIFVFLIPTAIAFKWIYKKAGNNIAEVYVVVCYLWSGYLLIAISLAVICLPWIEHYLLVRAILGIAFLIIATRQMFSLSWSVAVAKGLAIALAYFFCTILVVSILIFFSHLVGFEPLMIPPPSGN